MYGTQAHTFITMEKSPFENDVKMYGTQAVNNAINADRAFENDVKMYGTQAMAHRQMKWS